MFSRKTILMLTITLSLLGGRIMAADAISVSKIDGLDPTNGGLLANTPIRFYVHYQAGADTVTGFTNGFRVFSPDGAIWQPLDPKVLINIDSLFAFTNGVPHFLHHVLDGMGADTIMAHGVRFRSPGFVPGFNKDYFYIETSVSENQIGKSLCLDSSFYDLSNWLWSTTGGGRIPSWDGPHCFEIVDCCSGNRGDVNGDGVNHNILDLTRLVDYLFRGSAPPDCKLESDVNGDGTPYNIIDLTFVVDYIHRGGPAAGPCPN